MAVGWLVRLMELLKMMAFDSGAKAAVNTQEDQGTPQELLNVDLFSHQRIVGIRWGRTLFFFSIFLAGLLEIVPRGQASVHP